MSQFQIGDRVRFVAKPPGYEDYTGRVATVTGFHTTPYGTLLHTDDRELSGSWLDTRYEPAFQALLGVGDRVQVRQDADLGSCHAGKIGRIEDIASTEEASYYQVRYEDPAPGQGGWAWLSEKVLNRVEENPAPLSVLTVGNILEGPIAAFVMRGDDILFQTDHAEADEALDVLHEMVRDYNLNRTK